MAVSNEEILKAVQDKIGEKNEVITEQQLQIQGLMQEKAELEQKVSDLEQQLADALQQASNSEDLLKQISEMTE